MNAADTSPQGRSAGQAAARAEGVWKVYGHGEAQVVALRDIDLTLTRAQFTAIMGPSGSGKSTLMHCLAGLDTTTRGDIRIGETSLTGQSDTTLTKLRRHQIGFIFQQFNLLPTLSAEENILLPLTIAGRKPDPAWYRTITTTTGLTDRLQHRPTQLSGGQQQRVACARALITKPDLILADEPTGNLDSGTSHDILSFLHHSVHQYEQTIAMVTHDPTAAAYADRVVFLADGAITDELTDPTPDTIHDTMKRLESPHQPTTGNEPVGVA